MSEHDIENLRLKDIQPLNMQKRVRVFTGQLLPGMVIQATTKDAIRFTHGEVQRLGFKFIERLARDNRLGEIIEVQTSMHKAITELSRKFHELVRHEQDKKSRTTAKR